MTPEDIEQLKQLKALFDEGVLTTEEFELQKGGILSSPDQSVDAPWSIEEIELDSAENELKSVTKRYSWQYTPSRYQAMVATIVSAFLYFNLFGLLFEMQSTGSINCGTLLRPIMEDDSVGMEDDSVGWIWNSRSSFFSLNEDLRCPRQMQAAWWEFIATFAALAICGLVMRRAIKRENASA